MKNGYKIQRVQSLRGPANGSIIIAALSQPATAAAALLVVWCRAAVSFWRGMRRLEANLGPLVVVFSDFH